MRSDRALNAPTHQRWAVIGAGGAMMLLLAGAVVLPVNSAQAIGTSLDLGTSGSYSVLAGQTVTNTGPSTLDGDLGVSPGSALTGFPPGQVGGAMHPADANAGQAQSDLTIAYNNAAGQASDADVNADLGGARLLPGVYTAAGSTLVTGSLTLDAEGDPDAVFIFQIGSALTTASGSAISLVNGASSCRVFWQGGSSATLGTGTTFVGTILALTSISTGTGTTVEGYHSDITRTYAYGQLGDEVRSLQ